MDFREQIIELIKELPNQILESQIMWMKIFWDSFIETLINHWLIVLVFFVILLAVAIINFIVTGRWGMIASIFYRVSYLGILFIVISTFGVEALVSNSSKFLLFFIGIIAFEIVGVFIRKLRFK